MVCQICGEYIVQEFVEPEVAMVVHRLLKHQPPVVQGFAIVGLTFGVLWVFWRTVAAVVRATK